ncbi:nitrate reductase molybdenum cofactor assembly chaperone [Actinomadura rugatobispora]|uniref:Nitrate reductase molybdenum cofactor assembly chaperone n=1 Tax=Actinomadura rugatobispora TaxID=1994 RepID=A0ABW0ZWH5_9ACTN|nr:nitrate reductase molybdenum cofactor assembly chaperone [Actinomadura rugatobispora]
MIKPIVWQSASLLLNYPGPGWARAVSLVTDAVGPGKGPAAEAVRRFVRETRDVEALELQARYVATFDRTRRRTLYMTYYTDGDTRSRGGSLAALKARYRAAGWAPEESELPDFLPVMLEFAARCPAGGALLAEHGAGLELLRRGLDAHGSPYALLVDAVRATLPSPGRAERRSVRSLARTGPPAETVGLEGAPGLPAFGASAAAAEGTRR